MKRFLALFLTFILLAASLSGCSLYYRMFGFDTELTGQTFYMYLGDMPSNLDPAFAYLDDSALAIASLIYEGLYKYDSEGNVTEALAESCNEISFDEKTGELQLELTIRDSCWSDQVHVQADQFIYAWRRLLEPSFSSAAAVLLYDIKNAKDIKTASGNVTVYDLGVHAVDTRVMQITLVGKKLEDGTYSKPSIKAFKEKLASPMLVPIRSDKLAKLTDWATSNESVASNGPFYLRTYHQREDAVTKREREIRLQRNIYYLRDQNAEPLDKYVEPYQISIRFSIDADRTYAEDGTVTSTKRVFDTAGQQAVYYYENGYLDYMNYLPLSYRADYADKVALYDSLFTHSYLFNTKNALFSDARVRRALSMAIDRTELAKQIVFAKPARSILTSAAREAGVANDPFIDHLTNGIDETKADIAGAKALLAEAGVSGGSFTISIRDEDEVALAAAEFCASVWKEQLNFDVEIRRLQTKQYLENDYNGIYDTYQMCYRANGEPYNENAPTNTVSPEDGFDVIAVDLFTNGTDPFTTLAQFSKLYSGMALDMSVVADEYEASLPMTSYNGKRFNLCMQSAFETPANNVKAAYLHAAEAQLMEDMPVMPLFTLQNSVLQKDGLKDVTYSLGGVPVFTQTTLKNYVERTSTEIQELVVEARKKELGLTDAQTEN